MIQDSLYQYRRMQIEDAAKSEGFDQQMQVYADRAYVTFALLRHADRHYESGDLVRAHQILDHLDESYSIDSSLLWEEQ